jgi:hypothetical protein
MEKITRYDTFFAVAFPCCTILVDESLYENAYLLSGSVNDQRTSSLLKRADLFSLSLSVFNPIAVSGLIFSENLQSYYEFVIGCIDVELQQLSVSIKINMCITR